jgi:hypothetical protein
VWLDPSQGTTGHDVVGSSGLAGNYLDLFARRSDADGNWLAVYTTQDGARNSDLVLTTGAWHVVTWRLRANSPKHLQIRADTVYYLNDTGYTGIGTAPTPVAIGARQSGANLFKGDIAEIIFYTTSLSNADMTNTEEYLREKYGLAEAPPIPPTAPTGLTATAVDHERIDLAWTDTATDEDQFRVQRRLGQTGTFDEIGTVGMNVTSYSDSLLIAETEYCYRVLAFNSGGDSDPSNVACASTSPSPPPDPGPYGNPAPGYAAWFKADAIEGLTNNDPVTTWEDAGPHHKDATQANSSFRPVYKTNIVDGKPVIRFDGIDDRLVSPSGSDIWGLANHFTVFGVVWLDPSQGTAGHDVVGSSGLTGNYLDLFARRSDADDNWLAFYTSQDGARDSDLVLPTGAWYVLTWRLKANAPKHLQIRADAVYRLNDYGYTGIGTAPSPVAIGARQDGVNPFNGDIAEIIFYTTSLSDADMESTEDYLREKYGFMEPPPAPPSDLEAFASAYFRIQLSWIDSASAEEGFRIERRQGEVGPWEEVASVEANAGSYKDQSPPLSPETEYCYRVIAYNANGESAPSNEACDTTIPVPLVDCYSDPEGAQRSKVMGILADVNAEWTDAVGLTGADPNQLELITSDSICQQIWDGIGLGELPVSGSRVTFFQLGNRYIVADIPLVGDGRLIVGDDQFNLINPILIKY